MLIKRITKQNLSWALYDWANSAFATTVMAVFFPIFFNEYWSGDSDTVVTTARLGTANSAAGIILLFSAPVIGIMSDISGKKKKYLLLMTAMGTSTTGALYLVSQGDWLTALILYTLASVCFSGGNVFYDSLIKNVSDDDDLNFVSSLGFSLGYLGGGILLGINILMTLKPEVFGISDASQAVKLSFVTVGLWWLIFSLPLFFNVPEYKNTGSGDNFPRKLKQSVSQLIKTLKEIKAMKGVFLFLIAYWLYIDGVDTVIRMAMDFGISIKLDRNSMITALLLTQFIGFPSALLFGILAKGRTGARKGIYIAITVYLLVSVFGAVMTSEAQFYVLAIVIGSVQGGIQALSRSYFAAVIPKDREGEFFGLFNMVGKFAVILGPFFIGITGLILKNAGLSSEMATRGGILSVSLFFIAGGAVFYYSGKTQTSME